MQSGGRCFHIVSLVLLRVGDLRGKTKEQLLDHMEAHPTGKELVPIRMGLALVPKLVPIRMGFLSRPVKFPGEVLSRQLVTMPLQTPVLRHQHTPMGLPIHGRRKTQARHLHHAPMGLHGHRLQHAPLGRH